MDPTQEVVLTLLKFEHRYIPYEGMRRSELFDQATRDLGMPLDGVVMLKVIGPRLIGIVADSAQLAEDGPPEGEEISDREHLEICIGAAAGVTWCEGFAAGVFHAKRLADEGEMPNADR